MGRLGWTASPDLRVLKAKEETREREENQAEMGPDSQDPQDHPDHQARSSTRTQAVSTMSPAALDLREELVCLVRLDSRAQLDLKATVEILVCLDTVTRGRRGSQGWWWGLMEASDWRASVGRRAKEELWDLLDLLVHTVLRE